MIAGAGLNDRATVEFVVETRAARDRAAGRARRAVQHRGQRAAPDPRGRPQPSPHRPCRRRDRLGGAGGAAKRGRDASQHHAGARHGRDRPRHRPPRASAIRARATSGASMRSTARPGRSTLFTARATILATGGAGRTYLFSTAPRGATGDGIAMAWRAGCRVSNMEIDAVPPDLPLQSRGQELPDHRGGARRGRAAEATRRPASASCPITTRAANSRRATSSRARSTHEIKRSGSITSISTSATCRRSSSREHFPTIYEKLLGARHRHDQASRSRSCPAQHYTCGGVVIDLDGRTDLPGLYAAGEVHPVGPARRQPARLQLAARMLRVRRGGGQAHRRAIGTSCPPPPPIRAWDESRVTDSRRGGRHQAELDRDPPLHVELCRHRPHHQAARARPAPDQPASARSARLLRAFPRHARPDRAAQPAGGRRPDRPLGAAAQGKPRAALHARLSGHAARGERHDSCSITGRALVALLKSMLTHET